MSAASQLKTTQVNKQTQPAHPSWELKAETLSCNTALLCPSPESRIQGWLFRGDPPVERSIPRVIPSPGSCCSFTNEQFSICSPPTAGRPRGRSTTRRTRGEWAGTQSSLASYLLRNPLQSGIPNALSASCFLCGPGAAARVVFGCLKPWQQLLWGFLH